LLWRIREREREREKARVKEDKQSLCESRWKKNSSIQKKKKKKKNTPKKKKKKKKKKKGIYGAAFLACSKIQRTSPGISHAKEKNQLKETNLRFEITHN
jgi:hypothetical protein